MELSWKVAMNFNETVAALKLLSLLNGSSWCKVVVYIISVMLRANEFLVDSVANKLYFDR